MTALSINDLRRGATYLAKTCQGAVVGEYSTTGYSGHEFTAWAGSKVRVELSADSFADQRPDRIEFLTGSEPDVYGVGVHG